MEVRNVRWVGVRTDRYEAMVGFLRDVLGLRVNFEEATTVEFTTSEGDEVQVLAPGHPYYEFFRRAGERTRPPLRGRRCPFGAPRVRGCGRRGRGSTEQDSIWEWIHVRAPDGNLYEFASRLSEAD